MQLPAEDPELERLRAKLGDAEDALRAIQAGEIDAIVVQGNSGPVVYTLKSADTPYRLLVERMGEGALTVSSDGVILYANAAFANMVGLPAERLRGADLMQLLGNDLGKCSPSFFIKRGGRDVRLRTMHGELRDAYISSAPLIVDDKEVHCLIVTDLTRQQLRRRHEAIITSSADAIYSLSSDGTITTWNQAAERLYGYAPAEVIGRKFEILFPAEQPGRVLTPARLLAAPGAVHDALQIGKSGRRLEVAISIATFGDGDSLEGFAVIARDVSERNRVQDHIKFLLRESAHRTKNLLSVIQAIAAQTARSTDTVAQYQERFGQRLRSMALSHDLLVTEDWKRASLAELARLQLHPFAEAGPRLTLEGSDVFLTPEAVQHIGLALHELATNAAKYGALSVPTGRVAIRWRLVTNGADRELHLSWCERNGPRVSAPTHSGFGSIVTEKIVAQSLDAKVATSFAPEGLLWAIEIPSHYLC